MCKWGLGKYYKEYQISAKENLSEFICSLAKNVNNLWLQDPRHECRQSEQFLT
jgi:hypothetical protein